MKNRSGCNFESAVVKTLKSGAEVEEVSAHLETCADCRETAKVMRFFQRNLPKESAPKNLPAAGLVMWKFRLREKQRAAEQINRPLFIAQIIAAVVLCVFLVWFLNTDAVLSAALNRVFASLEQILALIIAGTLTFAVIAVTIIFTLRRFLLEK